MSRVDLNDERLNLCKCFLKACNKGKGQNVRIRINEESIKKFLSPDALLKECENKPRWGYSYSVGHYLELVKKAVEKTLAGFRTCYGMGFGDWEGTNRQEEILKWEAKLQKTLKFYRFLSEIKIDNNAFNYIIKYGIDDGGELSIIYTPLGEKNCGDLERLTKFLELLCYTPVRDNRLPDSLIAFYGLDIDKMNENKLVWEFI